MKHIDINLKTLPKEHYLRRASLGSIGAMMQPMDSTKWIPVFASLKNRCYNNLGEAWTLNDQWKATIDPYDCDEPTKTEL